MTGYGGFKNYGTWRLYVTLRDTMEYRLMIEDWLVQWAEQGYSKSDAATRFTARLPSGSIRIMKMPVPIPHGSYKPSC